VLGRRISQTDQAGHTTQYDYDTLGRLFTITDPMSHITQFGYDALGEKISQTDANGHITQFAYDNRGRLLSKLLPMGQSDGRTYDALGRLFTQTDFGGKMTTFGYDPLSGRLMSKTASIGGTPTGESVSFTYNTDGTRATATRTTASGSSVGTVYAYYPNGDYRQGQLRSVTTAGKTITYDYDLLGNKISTLTPGGSRVSYAYDPLNRLFTVTHPDSAITTFTYDKVGNRQSVSRATSATAAPFSTTLYYYDSLNRLTDLINQTGGGVVVSSYHYGLRADGKRQSLTESGPYTNRGLTVYTYDDSGKLTEENGPYADIQYGYDNVGNRLTKTVTGAAASTSATLANGITLVNGTTNYAYDLNDRITSQTGTAGTVTHTYDADGNETTVNGQAAGYDFENHLVSLASTTNNTLLASYIYDADGNRYSAGNSTTTTSYVVDTSLAYASVVEEYTGTTLANGTLAARYDYGDDLVRMDRSSGVYYYIYDGLGSTRQLVNTSGTVTDSYGYSAFGEMASHTGNTQNPFLFNAQQFDGASGDYFLRARYYDQSNGRFISQDPFGGSDQDSVSLHRYLYAGNNPVNMVDPGGKEETLFGVSIGTGIQASLIQSSVLYGALGAAGAAWDTALQGGSSGQVAGSAGTGLVFGALAGVASRVPGLNLLLTGLGTGLAVNGAVSAFQSGNVPLGIYRSVWAVVGVLGLPKAIQTARIAENQAMLWRFVADGADTSTVGLYRAVGIREYNDVMSSNTFRPGGNSMEGRQFAFTLDEALEYARTDPSKVAVIKATVNTEALPNFDFSDRIDPFIFKNGVVTVQPGSQSDIFHSNLLSVEHVF